MAAADTGRSTRDRVLDAALASFAARGYQATSLDAVAAALGVTKQTVLYYHPSKEALLDAVIARAAADLADVLTGAVASSALPMSRRPAVVVDAVLRLGADRPEMLELVREVVRLGPPASTHMLEALQPLLERAASEVPTDRMVVVAAMVVGMATEVQVLRATGVEPDLAWLRRRRRAILAEVR